jgi:hypothetical protein
MPINWKHLRAQFFEECTFKKADTKEVKICIAPHDLFEWFKINIEKELKEKYPNKLNKMLKEWMESL